MPSTKPPAAGSADEIGALARELVAEIAAISTPSPGPSAGPAGGPGVSRPGSAPDYAWARSLLENAGRFVAPALPSDARLRSLKALLLRVLRVVSRDQATFNSAILEAVRSGLRATEQALKEVPGAAAEEAARGFEGAESRIRGDLDGLAAALGDGLTREAGAREALGHEVVTTQERVAGLEGDRDRTLKGLRGLEAGLTRAEEGVRSLKLEWTALRSELRDRIAPGPLPAPGVPPAFDPLRAGLYADFERQFRGSEAQIRQRQRKDVTLFRGAPGPVADLGCGRGEFLEDLREAGLSPLGCDLNPVSVARAREKKLQVDEADLFVWLAARPDGSLGGVTAYQVVEHLAPASLFDLVELSVRKLATGGRLLLETVNPESLYAMKWFWMDLTHVRPVPAPSLAHLLTVAGLKDVTVDFRSPVPEAEGLPAAALSDPALAAVARLLFAPQDYAVTGVK